MKTNSVPAVVMLSAGLIDCVLSIYQRLSLFDFTKRLLLVLVVFYLLGGVVKLILDINFSSMDDSVKKDAQEGAEPAKEGQETENSGEGISEEELENINAQEGSE